MQDLLNKIDDLKKELDSLRPMKQEHSDVLWGKFRLEWNYNSNHIEGNTMTYGDTKLLLRLGDGFKANKNTVREVNEMRAHDVAIFTIDDWANRSNRQLSESDIRELNRLILVENYWADAITQKGQSTRREIKVGQYKEQPNHVQLANGEKFYYAEPHEVPSKMNDLLDWYHGNQNEHPLIIAAFLHYKFVLIHPFDDGNGRVSRLLMNYHLMKNNFPPIIIKSSDKQNYLYSLNQADTGNESAFIEYLGEQLLWSLNLSLKAAKGESVEEKGDLLKEIEVWKKQVKSGIPTSPKRSDKDVMKLYDESINPLFDSIVIKSKVFEDLFRSVVIDKMYKSIKNNKGGKFDVWTQTAKFRKSKFDTLGQINLNAKLVNPVTRPDDDLTVEANLSIHFNVFNYEIKYNIVDPGNEISKPYNQYLSAEEINEVSDKFVKILYSRAKEIIQ